MNSATSKENAAKAQRRSKKRGSGLPTACKRVTILLSNRAQTQFRFVAIIQSPTEVLRPLGVHRRLPVPPVRERAGEDVVAHCERPVKSADLLTALLQLSRDVILSKTISVS